MKILLTALVLVFGYNEIAAQAKSIRNIDFRNFMFPTTYPDGDKLDGFTLKNGSKRIGKEQTNFLQNLYYGTINGINDYDDEAALVVVQRNDGTATYKNLYVYQLNKGRPILLQSFEFGDGMNIHLGAAFTAHRELVIERYIQKVTDSECCPSVIEISYYEWKKDKFILQGEPQQIPNGFLVRTNQRKD